MFAVLGVKYTVQSILIIQISNYLRAKVHGSVLLMIQSFASYAKIEIIQRQNVNRKGRTPLNLSSIIRNWMNTLTAAIPP